MPVLLFGSISTKLDIGTKPLDVETLKLSILSSVLPSFGYLKNKGILSLLSSGLYSPSFSPFVASFITFPIDVILAPNFEACFLSTFISHSIPGAGKLSSIFINLG